MWYTECQKVNRDTDIAANPVDYKLIEGIADKIIRRRLFLKGQFNPKTVYVNNIIQKIYNRLNDQYGNVSVVRTKMNTEQLTPIVTSIINDILH